MMLTVEREAAPPPRSIAEALRQPFGDGEEAYPSWNHAE